MLCLSEQILFTQRCEEAISGGALQELLIELEAQLAGRPQECVRACVCVYVCVCVCRVVGMKGEVRIDIYTYIRM